jgi:hypothetical protein
MPKKKGGRVEMCSGGKVNRGKGCLANDICVASLQWAAGERLRAAFHAHAGVRRTAHEHASDVVRAISSYYY